MRETQVIKAEVEEKFVDKVIRFAAEEGLSISNIKDAMNKVYGFMEDNAALNKDYHI